MKSKLALAVLIIALGGCTSTSDSTSEVASNSNSAKNDYANDGTVCRFETRVGSNRKIQVCSTAEQRQQAREAAREGILRLQGGSETGGDG